MRRRSSLKDELARLSEQEALAAEAERIAHIGTFVFDVATQTAVRSAEMMRIWGFTEREGPSGLDVILERIHPDDHAAATEDYRRILSEGGGADREVRLIMEDGVRPALVVGMPVGFVSAAESKDLMAQIADVPWIVIRGRKGGSTLVVAALHALLALAEAQQRAEGA